MTTKPPGRGSKGDIQSRVLSARLNPRRSKQEEEALKAWDELIKKGYTPRDIITDALNRLDGNTPEMFRTDERFEIVLDRLEERTQSLEGLPRRIEAIVGLVEDGIAAMLRELKRTDPRGLRRFVEKNDDDDGDELDEEFAENARKAARKSFRQRYGDE